MDLDGQFELNHFFLHDRKCNKCGKIKNLVDGFYRTRRDRGSVPSSYSYECKECTIKRTKKRKKNNNFELNYPDW